MLFWGRRRMDFLVPQVFPSLSPGSSPEYWGFCLSPSSSVTFCLSFFVCDSTFKDLSLSLYRSNTSDEFDNEALFFKVHCKVGTITIISQSSWTFSIKSLSLLSVFTIVVSLNEHRSLHPQVGKLSETKPKHNAKWRIVCLRSVSTWACSLQDDSPVSSVWNTV